MAWASQESKQISQEAHKQYTCDQILFQYLKIRKLIC